MFILLIVFGLVCIDTSDLPDVWYTSTPLAPDFEEMYKNPSEWSEALNFFSTIKFYSTEMRRDCPPSACGKANITYFEEIGVFDVMKEKKIKLALETESLCPEDCEVKTTFEIYQIVRKNLEKNGAEINFIDMDEPMWFGKSACKISTEETAKRVVENYIKPIQADNKTYTIDIGDVEPYPALSANEIIDWLQALKKPDEFGGGMWITHFQVDVDFHHVGKDLWKARRDLRKIRDFCDENELQFGTIMNPAGFSPSTDQEYYERTMKNVHWWHDNLGSEENGFPSKRILFQSWEPGVPRNVPEKADYTGTKTLLDGMKIFQSIIVEK